MAQLLDTLKENIRLNVFSAHAFPQMFSEEDFSRGFLDGTWLGAFIAGLVKER